MSPEPKSSPGREGPRAHSHKESFHLSAPGGRVGLPRLKGLITLLRPLEDPRVMISRRQGLIVRCRNPVPTFLHRELLSRRLSDPNVKSYPIEVDDPLEERALQSLKTLRTQSAHPLRLSYSPGPRWRGELRRDDFCLVKVAPGRLRIDSGSWGEPPRTLLPEFSAQQLDTATSAVVRVLNKQDRPLNIRPFRTVRRDLLRAYNDRSRGGGTSPVEDPVEPTFLHEDRFLEAVNSDRGTTSQMSSAAGWRLMPVPEGVIDLPALKELTEKLLHRGAQRVRLTPEQNLLYPLPEESPDHDPISPGPNADRGRSLRTRISTCPGEKYCRNARLDPVSLAAHIRAHLSAHPDRSSRAPRLPVGISACGETRRIERLKPLALIPDPDEGIRLFTGGHPHGDGRLGTLQVRNIPETDVPEVILTQMERIPPLD